MRLFEMEDLNDPDKIYRFINANCKPYIREFPKYSDVYMFRGLSTNVQTSVLTGAVNRKPVDTPEQIQILLDKAFTETGFIANRSNSIFVTSNYMDAEEYSVNGYVYAIFPIGEFDFTYSTQVRDFYFSMETFFHKGLLQFDYDFKVPGLFGHLPSYTYQYPMMSQIYNSIRNETLSLNELFARISKQPDFEKQKFVSRLRNAEIRTIIKLTNIPVIDTGLTSFVKENYTNTNLPNAISEGVEIMIRCDKYLAVPHNLVEKVFEG